MFCKKALRKTWLWSIAFVCMCFSLSFSASAPYLIGICYGAASGGGGIPPSNLINNASYIESLPFDGVLIRLSSGWTIFTNNPQSYASIYNELSTLKGKYSKLNHSYVFVGLADPGDWFDSWTTCVQNFANLAKACKDVGLEGVVFDPEGGYNTFDYSKQKYASTKSLDDYRAQARVRGKEIMQACVAEYPSFKMMTLHGPYASEPKVPSYINRQSGGAAVRLLGAFFCGWLEGSGTQGIPIDGGEIYSLRTEKDFQDSYQWRKHTIASNSWNSPNIPPADRAIWPTKVSISFGVYQASWSAPMSPAIMRTTMEIALKTCDYMVWFYSEGNFLTPGGLTQDWINALKGACDAAKTGINFTSSENASVPLNSPFGYKVKYDNKTGSAATLTYIKKPSWITAVNGNDSIYGTTPSVMSVDTVRAVVAAGGKSDTLNLKIVIASYIVFEAEKGSLVSPMQIGQDPAASGGQYITTPAGSGNTISPKIEATYSFNAPFTGNYYVWLCVYAPNIIPTANYGTFVGFNTTFAKPGLRNQTAGKYEWVMSNVISLNAGANQLIVGHGNEQIRIDKIVITNSPSAELPSGVTGSIPREKKNVTEQKQNLSIRITPSGSVQFQSGTTGLERMYLSVRDIFGREMWSNQGERSNGMVWNPKEGNSKISNGVYFVVLQQKEGMSSEIGKFALAR